jgi:mRNA-degrading endonuclease RelE of RelBE toxin-antitoxin system
MATVVVPPEVFREMEDLPTRIVARMRKLVERLKQWPDVSGVKHLRGDLAGKHRVRTGDYRLQFRVEEARKTRQVKRVVKGKEVVQEHEVVEHKVILEKAGHRDGFYDD